ncbi:hypothetical protein DKM44_05950 [Deinococcus irradiatisoli]|uniref:Uncharacterized protein n=2 Tax=Deinococcus irradiatisoli TaxID=2202254 RepID=A0A2Z3JNS9_9DEIO|nr:hypothetical protein DKM44_05950 [Deinococcus irradiatisoli]
MGLGAVLFVIGMNALGQGGVLLGLLIVALGALLFMWGLQHAFVGSTMPRLGQVLVRAGQGLQ